MALCGKMLYDIEEAPCLNKHETGKDTMKKGSRNHIQGNISDSISIKS